MPIGHLGKLFLDPEINFPLHTSVSPKSYKKNLRAPKKVPKNGPKKAKNGGKKGKIFKNKNVSRYMGPMREATPKL